LHYSVYITFEYAKITPHTVCGNNG
jgi:hypothetical protein